MKEYEQTDSITGNELEGDEIAEFSKKLDVNVLVDYCKAVMDSTDELLRRLTYADLNKNLGKRTSEYMQRNHERSQSVIRKLLQIEGNSINHLWQGAT